MPAWMNIYTQDSNSPLMEQLIFFHDHVMMIINMILIIITYFMINLLMNKFTNRFLIENQPLEILWTLMPIFILLFITFPSLKLLYLLDEIKVPVFTLKIMGHQWYWSYEYSDFSNFEMDSYLKPQSNPSIKDYRLLDVDNQIIAPLQTQIRIIISSYDVLHSWTIPSLGIKVDAIPGRLNQSSMFMKRPGLFFGQCSEICGLNHSFMPIVMQSVPLEEYMKWMKIINK
nr:cytochrome c oxidase subunit II [Peloridium hammoniorum]